ncbi:MAG: hypothetical protein Q4B70_00865 [Lachnospiraceae bacterium]|nr:hypothetical protein [Lachnospiraceae bacterium]
MKLEEKRSEYTLKRKEALDTFRIFIKECAEKGMTVQQIRIIGNNAKGEVDRIISDAEKEMVIIPDLSELLKSSF